MAGVEAIAGRPGADRDPPPLELRDLIRRPPSSVAVTALRSLWQASCHQGPPERGAACLTSTLSALSSQLREWGNLASAEEVDIALWGHIASDVDATGGTSATADGQPRPPQPGPSESVPFPHFTGAQRGLLSAQIAACGVLLGDHFNCKFSALPNDARASLIESVSGHPQAGRLPGLWAGIRTRRRAEAVAAAETAAATAAAAGASGTAAAIARHQARTLAAASSGPASIAAGGRVGAATPGSTAGASDVPLRCEKVRTMSRIQKFEDQLAFSPLRPSIGH